jgi:peptidylprolyl isomerase
MKSANIAAIVIFLLGVILVSGCNRTPDKAEAKYGNTVQVNYTGKLTDGSVFDTSVGREPLEFALGTGKVIPGFEKAVLGMKAGEKKTVTIPAEEAYGPYRDNLSLEISRELLPNSITPQVGLHVQQKQENGSVVVAIITKISDKTVTIDANHPLAGQVLTFEIELVKIL